MKVFRETQAVIDTWPLWVNDATSLDIGQLAAHAQMMIRREKIKLIAVDYLQLLKAEAQTRYDRVTKVSESLRELAKYTGVPVIVVSQLSRPEDKKIRPPRPFDLKEAGSIENDAHVIIMPYRPQDRDGHFTGEDLIIVGKQREGPTGSVKVRFSTNTLTFDPRGEDEEIGEMF
jgi:replicative DNA helicase